MKRDIENAELFVFNDNSKSFEKLGKISGEITTSTSEDSASESRALKSFTESHEGSFSVTVNGASGIYEFYLITGQRWKIPNNWLKHHGQPMNKKPWKKTPAIIKRFRREMRRRKKQEGKT